RRRRLLARRRPAARAPMAIARARRSTDVMATATRTRRVDGAGRVALHVVERGDAAAPTVVLVHGYPDDHTVWDPVAERLAARYHVVTYDVRGAGQSDAPRRVRDYRVDLLAADTAAVIDA